MEVIRNTVKARAPGILLAEISALPRPPVDRDGYRLSWRVMNIPGGARVYSTAPYAIIIERGRRPGARMPPIDVIAAWVVRKGLVNLGRRARGKSPSATLGTSSQVRSIAFLIARSIARRGLPARWVMRNAAVKIDMAVREELARVGTPGV